MFAESDRGRIFRSTNAGASWDSLGNPLSLRGVVVSDSGVLFAVANHDVMKPSGDIRSESALYRSSDNGDHWSEIRHELGGNAVSTIADGKGDVAVGIAEEFGFGIAYAVALYSSDNGNTWSAWSIGKAFYAPLLEHLAFDSTGALYAAALYLDDTGIWNGSLVRYSRDSSAWQVLKDSIHISAIAIAPDGEIIIGGRGLQQTPSGLVRVRDTMIHRSTNAGATWTESASGLPGILLPAALCAPNDDERYLALLASGIYRSTDRGATWSEFNTGLPTYSFNALISNSDQTLYAGSTAHGIYSTLHTSTAVSVGEPLREGGPRLSGGHSTGDQ